MVHETDRFATAFARYGVWPTTVWHVVDSDEPDRKLKRDLGDLGDTRSHDGAAQSYKRTVGGNTQGTVTSIFPPRVALNILKLYASEATRVYDPFAGGGCRAVMAAKAGLDYIGVEIREDEVDNIYTLAARHNATDNIDIICGDSRDPHKAAPSQHFDFCYTCPPYWSLEQYRGGDNDLSMMTYNGFLSAITDVVTQCKRVLKRGSKSVWVVGLHRHKDGTIAPIPDDIARIHVEQGFAYKEQIIIFRDNKLALQRVGNFEKDKGLLIRRHEYALVFERR